MKMETVIYKNKTQTLKGIIEDNLKHSSIRCVELYNEKDDQLFSLGIDDDYVVYQDDSNNTLIGKEPSDKYIHVMNTYGDLIPEEYAITGPNLQIKF